MLVQILSMLPMDLLSEKIAKGLAESNTTILLTTDSAGKLQVLSGQRQEETHAGCVMFKPEQVISLSNLIKK